MLESSLCGPKRSRTATAKQLDTAKPGDDEAKKSIRKLGVAWRCCAWCYLRWEVHSGLLPAGKHEKQQKTMKDDHV